MVNIAERLGALTPPRLAVAAVAAPAVVAVEVEAIDAPAVVSPVARVATTGRGAHLRKGRPATRPARRRRR